MAVDQSGLLSRPIPKSGELLPVIGLGTWRTFDIDANVVKRAGPREVLDLLAKSGTCMVDSSPMYGAAEGVVGDLVHELDLAKRLFLATKVWTRGREEGIRQMETSLKRLRVSSIDLMQVHNLLDWAIHLKTLAGWKEQGRVRYVGITHYLESAYAEIERVIESAEVDFVQLNYSIAARAAERRLLPLAQERGVAVVVNRPFEEGSLLARLRAQALPSWAAEIDCANWAQFMLKFVLSHPAVTCVIPATDEPEHMRENLHAGHGRLPDAASREKMARYLSCL
ncbi:MAG: aldo/keto reductase [Acidiferrobacterales bacterium]